MASIRPRPLRPALAVAALLGLAAPMAQAQDGNRLAFRIGAGVSSVPGYFGSGDSEIGPSVAFEPGFLRFGGLSLGNEDPDAVDLGLGFRPSLRYVPSRTADEFAELEGLDDIGTTVEVGGGVEYGGGWYEAFAVARIGLGGHSEISGELGMDLVSRPSDRLELRAGPRITIGSQDYAATYFGVTEEEAAASAFPSYDPDGGILSSGIEVGASYDLTDQWGVSATARYDRLQGDAAASPITTDDDQVSASVELTRRFDFSF